MAYTVKAFALEAVNLAPESTLEEILQNVAVIISTPKFSVPLERGMGLSQRFIDKPIPAAQSILISEVMEAISAFEPRAEVENVTFELGHAGVYDSSCGGEYHCRRIGVTRTFPLWRRTRKPLQTP